MNTTGNRNRDLNEPISFAQKCVIGLLRLLLPPHVDNEKAADYLRTQIGQNNASIEWVAVRPDGLRYIYGIPAYNLEKKEVSFNADLTETIDCEKNTIGYSSTDAPTGNTNAVNNFYSKTETPYHI